MLIRSDRDAFQPPRGNPVTPRALYQGRRALLQAWAAGAAGAALAPWAAREAQVGQLYAGMDLRKHY